MSIFLAVYFSLYGLMHYYAFRKVRTAFQATSKTVLLFAIFMLLMISAPIFLRLAERLGIETGLTVFAYVAFSWMGILFLFITILIFFDSFFIGMTYVRKIFNYNFTNSQLNKKKIVTIQMVLTLAIYCYGLFEATAIRNEHVIISSPKIPDGIDRLRILQISDVHLGLIVNEKRLRKIAAAVIKEKPDLLVSTGDLVDGQLNNLSKEIEILSTIKPSLGKIAITGNHEFYAGLSNSLDFIAQSGFTILRHAAIEIGGISIIGVDDWTASYFGQQHAQSESKLLASQPETTFKLLLKHRPSIDPESLGNFDLQLSGHTHKGQIFPFNLLTWFFFPVHAGQLTSLGQGKLYLSRGTGTWGPPIRFLAPPEITIIDLVHGP